MVPFRIGADRYSTIYLFCSVCGFEVYEGEECKDAALSDIIDAAEEHSREIHHE